MKRARNAQTYKHRHARIRCIIVILFCLLCATAKASNVIATYYGYFRCMQGDTLLRLKILQEEDISAPNAIVEFVTVAQNAAPPIGAYTLNGNFDPSSGVIDLLPVAWLLQPRGFTMFGLSGDSADGGESFSGTILSGVGCTEFHLQKSSDDSTPMAAIPDTPAESSQPAPTPSRPAMPHQVEVTLITETGGTVEVPVRINDVLTLNFIIDSGASDVAIPNDVAQTLLRAGTIAESDVMDKVKYTLADGSHKSSQRFRIRKLKVGSVELEDVVASIAPKNGVLLLGQSFLSRFKSWSIDNNRKILILQ